MTPNLPPIPPPEPLDWDSFPPGFDQMCFGGRGYRDPVLHERVYADVAIVRVDDGRDESLWAEIRIRPGRLIAWLEKMGYTVTKNGS